MSTEAKIISGIGLLTGIIVIGAALLLGKPAELTQAVSDPKVLAAEDSWKLGPSDAKVTIVEFGDYQCPACGVYHPIVKQLLQDYSGKVSLTFRHFPLPQHQNALPAAIAAEAAGKQGKFWDMHDMLYGHQSEWETATTNGVFTDYAKRLGLDEAQFTQDLTSPELKDRVMRDAKAGQVLGISSTPTFFVNGKKVVMQGSQSLKQAIDQALSATN